MKINNHWLTSADKIDSPNCDTRDDEEDISLIVIHCISLPEGQFNTPYIEQLFTNQLSDQSHPDFAKICHLQVSSHIVFLEQLSLSNHMCCFNSCNRCLSGVKRFKSHHWFGYFFDKSMVLLVLSQV
jgi:N-acetyl-anhydromuramyl-L-alanine amidase AmpD